LRWDERDVEVNTAPSKQSRIGSALATLAYSLVPPSTGY
jgi:hypothetical protein